jgi:hypothetical protein
MGKFRDSRPIFFLNLPTIQFRYRQLFCKIGATKPGAERAVPWSSASPILTNAMARFRFDGHDVHETQSSGYAIGFHAP